MRSQTGDGCVGVWHAAAFGLVCLTLVSSSGISAGVLHSVQALASKYVNRPFPLTRLGGMLRPGLVLTDNASWLVLAAAVCVTRGCLWIHT
jgi:hypothetical protein